MMKHLCSGLMIVLFCFLCNSSKAQTALQASQIPSIARYYTLAQLQELEQHDTTELHAVIYYYTHSFIVEPIQCSDCLPFDSTNFDVSKYEYLRLTDQTYIRSFDKYGFKLILLPINAMPYYYPIQHVPKVDPGEIEETQTQQK
jgi:hypothetical protein